MPAGLKRTGSGRSPAARKLSDADNVPDAHEMEVDEAFKSAASTSLEELSFSAHASDLLTDAVGAKKKRTLPKRTKISKVKETLHRVKKIARAKQQKAKRQARTLQASKQGTTNRMQRAMLLLFDRLVALEKNAAQSTANQKHAGNSAGDDEVPGHLSTAEPEHPDKNTNVNQHAPCASGDGASSLSSPILPSNVPNDASTDPYKGVSLAALMAKVDELTAQTTYLNDELQQVVRANACLKDENLALHTYNKELEGSGTPRSTGRVPQRLTEKRKHMNSPPTYDQKGKTSLTDWEAIVSTYLREGEFPEADWVAIANTYLSPHLQRALFMDVSAEDKRISDYGFQEFLQLVRRVTGSRSLEQQARDDFDKWVWKGGCLPTNAASNHTSFLDVIRRCGTLTPDNESQLRKYSKALPTKIYERIFPRPGGGEWTLTELLTAVDAVTRAVQNHSPNDTAANGTTETWCQVAKKAKPNGPPAGFKSKAAVGKPATPLKNKAEPKWVPKTPEQFTWLTAEHRCLKCGAQGHTRKDCPVRFHHAEAQNALDAVYAANAAAIKAAKNNKKSD